MLNPEDGHRCLKAALYDLGSRQPEPREWVSKGEVGSCPQVFAGFPAEGQGVGGGVGPAAQPGRGAALLR